MHPAVLRGGDREEDRVDRRSLDGLRGEGSQRETGASSKKNRKKRRRKGKKGRNKRHRGRRTRCDMVDGDGVDDALQEFYSHVKEATRDAEVER